MLCCRSHLRLLPSLGRQVVAAGSLRTIKQSRTVTQAPSVPQDKDELLPQQDTGLAKQIRFFYERYGKDHVLLVRVGSFYELYGRQAHEWAAILDLKLTEKSYTGFPHYRLEHYLAEIVMHNRKVAIVEQTQPGDGKEIKHRSFPSKNGLWRHVSQIVTPGTFVGTLRDVRIRYLLSVSPESTGTIGMAVCDVTSGEVKCSTVPAADLERAIRAVAPAEVLLPLSIVRTLDGHAALDDDQATHSLQQRMPSVIWTVLEPDMYRIQESTDIDRRMPNECQAALRGLTKYLYRAFDGKPVQLKRPAMTSLQSGFLDVQTVAELELFSAKHKTRKVGNLCNFLDHTVTKAGARLLSQRLASPALDLRAINIRHDMIEQLNARHDHHTDLVHCLKELADCAPLDMIVQLAHLAGKRPFLEKYYGDVAAHLRVIEKIRHGTLGSLVQPLSGQIPDLARFLQLFDAVLADYDRGGKKAAAGSPIRQGYSAELDGLRAKEEQHQASMKDTYLKLLLQHDLPKTCKLRRGGAGSDTPFVEVSVALAESLRERGLVVVDPGPRSSNARVYFEELVELHSALGFTRVQIKAQEANILKQLREKIKYFAPVLRAVDNMVAELDVIQSLATVARTHGYQRPTMTTEPVVSITGGFHPLVHQLCLMEGRLATRNDCHLDAQKQSVCLISGPNMGGKSTYLRQVAVTCLLAHIGSFVPAASATVGLFDNIFARFDAHDDLEAGKSTFVKEISEVAYILQHAGPRSLIFLDELGRGTTYRDGCALTASVVRWVARRGVRCMMTTHYPDFDHMLRSVMSPADFERIAFRHSSINEDKMQRKVYEVDLKMREGCIRRMYGLEVAGWTEMPDKVLEVAHEVRARMVGRRSRSHHAESVT